MHPDNIPEKLAFDYEFIKKIGEGANGETWLAQHLFNGRKAAIKCLKLGKIDDIKTLELFNRESELLKSVNVFGVPQFYDYYPPQNGGNGYLVQEYIQAPSIQTMIDQGTKFNEHQALEIAERVAKILYHLEMEYLPPIIHRDIKPANILYRQADNMVYLIDFGSVANSQKRADRSTVAGTLGYMPPEQIMGNVTIQSDYYALGATILHMVTGIPPYKLDSNAFKIDIKSAFKLSHIKASNTLIHLLTILLSPDIDKRPQTARELLEEIQIALGTKTIQRKSHFSVTRIIRSLFGWIVPIGMRQNALTCHAGNVENQGFLTIREIERQIASGECSSDIRFRFYIRNWRKCDGILRKYKEFVVEREYKDLSDSKSAPRNKISKRVVGVQYTFEVDGFLWDGFCEGSNDNIQYPRKCSVIYNPKDPRQNALEYIYEIDG